MYGAVCVAKVWGTQEVLQRDTEHGYDLFDMGAREATVTSVWEAGSLVRVGVVSGGLTLTLTLTLTQGCCPRP